jgi:hypothetical protein
MGEKHKHRHRSRSRSRGHERDRKEKHRSKKRHRRSRSGESSDSGADRTDALPLETAAQELGRLRTAADLLRETLRAFPAVRKDLRLLLWNLDAGQGVDLRNLGGA